MRFPRLAAVLLLGGAACGTSANEEVGVEVRSFILEKADPPAEDRGGRPLVRPRSRLEFRWEIEGDASRLQLTANDVPIALHSANEGPLPTTAIDSCDDEICGTARLGGEVEYRLTAWDQKGRQHYRTIAVGIAADPGLQIVSFTSNPQNVVPGASVELQWEALSAVEATLEAAPLGGGALRTLGTFTGPQALSGTHVDPSLQVSTLYRLRVRDDEGQSREATIALPLRGEAWITEIATDPEQVAVEQPFRLSWKSSGLERLTILRDDGGATIDDIAPHELDEGFRKLSVRRDTLFSFVGVSSDGEVVTERCNDGGCVPATALVRIHPGPAVVAFEPDEQEIEVGKGTTLRWEVLQADQVTVAWMENGVAREQTYPADTVAMPVTPPDTTRYTLVATGGGRTASRHAVVGVRPKAKVFGPNDVRPGEVYDISWTTEGATSVELLVDGKRVEVGNAGVAAGSVTVTADTGLTRGGSFEVVLTALDDETPRRKGTATIRIGVE